MKAGILFQTGNIDLAIRAGAQETGFNLPQGYTFVNVQRWMGIFHEMPPAGQALSCAACHDATAASTSPPWATPPRRRATAGRCGTSCHEQEDMPSFYSLHNEHARRTDPPAPPAITSAAEHGIAG